MSAPGPCYDQLAFSGGEGEDDLLTAKVRRPFRPSSSNSNCLLNVEIFGSQLPLLSLGSLILKFFDR